MSSSQPSTTTQIQKVELPAWVNAASEGNYKDVAEFADNRQYTPYDGRRVAMLSDDEKAASGILGQGMDSSNAAFGTAANTASQAARGGLDVTAGGFLSRDINKYMDPEINNVVNTTMTGMRQNLDRSANGLTDQARGAGAWGGSRFGVEDAVLKAQGAQGMAQTEAGLRSNAFKDAAGLIQQDNASALQASLANQSTRMAGGQLALGTGQAQADTAGRNAILSTQIGSNERGIRQAMLDTDYQNFMDKQNFPIENMNMKMTALGMSPYGKTSTTQTTQPQQSNGLMTGLGVLGTILPFMKFSDRDLKKNIKKIGKMPNDLNVYEYDYKKGVPGAGGPKQVGFMADDVKKKVGPHAVAPVKLGGKTVDAVDYNLAANSPRKPRDDKGIPRAPYRPRGAGFMSRAA